MKSYSWMVFLAVVFAVVVAASPAQAGPMLIFTDRAAFEAAINAPTTLQTFDSLGPAPAHGQAIADNPLSFADGITAQAAGGLWMLPGAAYSGDVWLSTNAPALSSLTFTFGGGVYAVGGDFFSTNSEGSPLDNLINAATDDGSNLTISSLGGNYLTDFIGFSTGDPNVSIASLTISFPQGGGAQASYITVDNLEFASAPEPATLLLLGTGLLAVARRVRRRE